MQQQTRTMGPARIRCAIGESAATIAALNRQAGAIAAMGTAIVGALRAGNTVLAAGNGGSAAEAMHLVEELIGRYRSNRAPLRAVALAADATVLTCIANDFGFENVFARQVEGLGRAGDVLVVFSTSGNSINLERAVAMARARGMKVLALLGKDGGRLKGRSDHELIVASDRTAQIQEAHQVVMHLLLEIVEGAFPCDPRRP